MTPAARHVCLPLLLCLGVFHATASPPRDPWLPPTAQQAALAPQTRGAVLQAQVMQKLSRQFAAADRQGRGAVTLEDARRAGLGFVVEHFDAMARPGPQGVAEVRLQDLHEFMRQRQAR